MTQAGDHSKVRDAQAGFFSEKQYQCGASIAALRLANALSLRTGRVRYGYQMRRQGPDIQAEFPTVDFEQIGANLTPAAKKKLENAPAAARHAAEAQRLGVALKDALARWGAGIAHLHNFSGTRDTILDIAETAPIVWTMHDTSPVTGYHYRTFGLDDEPLEYKARLAPATERFWNALRGKPFALTAPSVWLANYARASAPDFIGVRHIPNVVPAHAFYPMDKALARAIVGIPGAGFFILFFAGRGAWRRKNFEILARAIRANADLPVNVMVVGGVADKELLHDRRFVFMSGFDPVADAAKITALYNAADAFCLSSLIDNLPNTVLEAISCGRPVIGSNTGGVPDMVKDGWNGWLFDPRDVASVGAALRRFLADAAKWPAMGANSLKLARTAFASEATENKFLDLYSELRERHAARLVAGVKSRPELAQAVAENA